MFGNKKEKIPIGPSIPFIEGARGEISLAYDSISVAHDDDRVTMTFIQGDVPVYAYTHEAPPYSTITFKNMKGKVDIILNTNPYYRKKND